MNSRIPPTYLFVALPFGVAMAGAWAAWGYQGSFLAINAWGTPSLDPLMLTLTHLGDGAILGGAVGLALVKRHPQRVISLLVLLLLSALLMALFKQLLFTGFDRPIRALGPQAVHYVAGHEPLHKSFPSGHTLTAFVCTAVAASGFANRWIQAGFALLAVLLGYTRIYLGVHFVADVLVAAGLGTLLAYGGLRYVEPRAMQWLARWLNADTARRNLQLVLAAACSLSLAVGAYVRFWGGFYD